MMQTKFQQDLVIHPEEFRLFSELVHRVCGINLTPGKNSLVRNRLLKRLRLHNCPSFEAYFRLIQNDATGAELQVMVDLITTNETHFFREASTFRFFGQEILGNRNAGRHLPADRPFRVWSAAASSGEEAYSIAMVLADRLGRRPWSVLGSDINRSVLDFAASAVYAINDASDIPRYYLNEYCLKGHGSMRDYFTVVPEIRTNVQFRQVNLHAELPDLPEFDCVFLRNILIYFSPTDKTEIVRRVLKCLRPGGYLMIGLSESLHLDGLRKIRPAVFQKL